MVVAFAGRAAATNIATNAKTLNDRLMGYLLFHRSHFLTNPTPGGSGVYDGAGEEKRNICLQQAAMTSMTAIGSSKSLMISRTTARRARLT
jgi:hypothetical protein